MYRPVLQGICNLNRTSIRFGGNEKHTVLAFGIYLVLSILLTWPLFLEIDRSLFGDYGDSRGGVSDIWAIVNGYFDGPINNLSAAPFGWSTSGFFIQPVTDGLRILLARLFNEITSYNVFVIFSFAITATATYYALNKLISNSPAAFIGGMIFGFCPASVMQATTGHVAYAFNPFIPLFVLALINNRSQRSCLSAMLVSASYSLVVLSSLYFGYFLIYVGLLFLLFDFYGSDDLATGLKKAKNYFCCLSGAVAMLAPFMVKVVWQHFSQSSAQLADTGHIRHFEELYIYSARLVEYIVPPVDHPLWGRVFYEYVRSNLHGSNIPEQTLYIGIVPLSLLLFSLIKIRSRRVSQVHTNLYLFFVFALLLSFFLSLPPNIKVADLGLPTLSSITYYVAPMFRVYARFGILVNFFLACIAAIVLADIFSGMRQRVRKIAIASLVLVVMLDYWSIPPGYASSVNAPPEVYKWLAKENGDIIIAEYPMMPRAEAAFYSYAFWQRLHKKKMVNGYVAGSIEEQDFFSTVSDLSNVETPQKLRAAGVRLVIVHDDLYRQGPIPAPIKRYFPSDVANAKYSNGFSPPIPPSFALIKSFGRDRVYSISE